MRDEPSPRPSLRAATEADRAFLCAVYGQSRTDANLLALWDDEAAREAFVRMQYDLQTAHYAKHYANARHEVIELDGEPVGRMWVHAGENELRLMDIALLPERRGAGLGTLLVEGLMDQARSRGVPLRLLVEHENPDARRFYERLGFVFLEDLGSRAHMEWRPA